jgi:hypothetical protein
MSDTIQRVEDGEEYPEVTEVEENSIVQSSSLDARMQARSRELESRTSEFFPIPGFEDILVVELQMLGFERQRRIARKHERLRDQTLQELYTAADCLIDATVRFAEVVSEGHVRSINDDWIELARRTGKVLPQDVTPRKALIAFVGSFRIVGLWQEWSAWCSGRREAVDREVVSDFGGTG